MVAPVLSLHLVTLALIRKRQCGHEGVSDLRMRNRCVLRGLCPVRSWVMMDESRLGRVSMSLRYALDGRDLSISLSFWNRGDFFQRCFQRFCDVARCSWRRAEMLRGRGVVRRKGGSLLVSLDAPWAASFASSSARSLGAKSTCPGVQSKCKSTTFLILPVQMSLGSTTLLCLFLLR